MSGSHNHPDHRASMTAADVAVQKWNHKDNTLHDILLGLAADARRSSISNGDVEVLRKRRLSIPALLNRRAVAVRKRKLNDDGEGRTSTSNELKTPAAAAESSSVAEDEMMAAGGGGIGDRKKEEESSDKKKDESEKRQLPESSGSTTSEGKEEKRTGGGGNGGGDGKEEPSLRSSLAYYRDMLEKCRREEREHRDFCLQSQIKKMEDLRSVYLYGLSKVSGLQDLREAPDAILPGNFVQNSASEESKPSK